MSAAGVKRMRTARESGFTLLELTIALVLLALLSTVLFGSLKLAGRSTDSGEAKADAVSSMRLAEDFLRTNLAQEHPLRMRKIVQFPLLFSGRSDELRYTAELPERVAGGGIWLLSPRPACRRPEEPAGARAHDPGPVGDVDARFQQRRRPFGACGGHREARDRLLRSRFGRHDRGGADLA